MQIEYLNEFSVLAQTLNFSEAARYLGMTQPALSKHIEMLEREFGAQLVNRSSRPIQLTSAGQTLYGEAESIYERYRQAKQRVRDAERHDCVVRIGMISQQPALMAHVAEAAARTEQDGTRLLCSFVQNSEKSIIKQLKDGDIDIALTFLGPRQQKMKFLKLVPIGEEPFSIIVRSTHPLAAYDTLHYADLEGQTFLHLGGEMFRMGWETIEEALERHQVRFATQSVLVRSEVDLATLDIGERLFVFVHENPHAQYFSEANGYRCLALDEPDACFRIFTVYRASEGSKGVLLERFAACIKETCAPA